MTVANSESVGAAPGDRVTTDGGGRRVRRRPGNWSTAALALVFPVSVLLLWQLAAERQWLPPVFLPLPAKVVTAFFQMVDHQDFADDFFSSLSIVGQAFIYGTVAGVLLGIAAGLSCTVERILGPTLDGLRHIPGIAWLPLIVLWIGIGSPAKIVVIGKSVFFPVFLNTLQGIRGVDRNFIELGRVLTLTRFQLVRRIIIPGAMPSILVGILYGASLAWALVVVAEGLSGMQGVGFLIFRAQSLLLTDQLIVCMIVIGLVGFFIDRCMSVLQRRVLRWKQGFEG